MNRKFDALRVMAIGAFAVSLFPKIAIAEDAIVTFYSHSSKVYGYPGSKNGAFNGLVFADKQRLFAFQEGFFVKTNRFITLKFPPGLHTFAATYGDDASKSPGITILLQGGMNYFLKARAEAGPYLVVDIEHGRLDQVTCQEAHKDDAKMKSLSGKTLSPEFTTRLVSASSMPSCP